MNNTVTLSQLITRLAKVADTDTNTSRRFLRTFFGAIEEALIEGESVTIKGIGTFRRTSDTAFGSATGLSFIPDEQLAKELNAPFEMFQAVELADGVVFPEDKEEASQPEKIPAKNQAVPEPVVSEPPAIPAEQATEPVMGAAPVPMSQETTAASKCETATPKPEVPVSPDAPVSQPRAEEPHKAPWEMEEFRQKETPRMPLKPSEEPEKPVAPVFEEAENIDEEVVPAKKPTSNLLWIGVGLIIAVGACIGLFAANYIDDEESVYTEEPAESSSAPLIEEISVSDVPETGAETPSTLSAEPAAPETQPSGTPQTNTPEPAPAATQTQPAPVETPAKKEPRYDTVTKTNYLAQMARRYYGHATYWVFIYEANTDVLHNPNRISPGTRVRIPDESELPGSTSAERQKIASQKCGELERRYK